MTLSSALVGALKSFNEMDPMTRAGMFPITDGAGFLNRIASSPAPQRTGGSLQTKREIVEAAGDSIQNAKVDPYVFSPPGMDIS